MTFLKSPWYFYDISKISMLLWKIQRKKTFFGICMNRWIETADLDQKWVPFGYSWCCGCWRSLPQILGGKGWRFWWSYIYRYRFYHVIVGRCKSISIIYNIVSNLEYTQGVFPNVSIGFTSLYIEHWACVFKNLLGLVFVKCYPFVYSGGATIFGWKIITLVWRTPNSTDRVNPGLTLHLMDYEMCQ